MLSSQALRSASTVRMVDSSRPLRAGGWRITDAAHGRRLGVKHSVAGNILDVLDDVGFHTVAAVGDHSVTLGQFQWCNVLRAQRQRQLRHIVGRIKPQLRDVPDQAFYAQPLQQPNRDQVA